MGSRSRSHESLWLYRNPCKMQINDNFTQQLSLVFFFFFKSYLFFWPEVEEVWKDWHLDNTRGSGLSGCQSMTYNGWHEISQSATSIWPLGLERRPGALFKSFCSDKNTWKDDTQFQSSERSLKMVFFKAHRVAKPNENFSELRRGKKEETGELIFALNIRVSLVRKWNIKFPTHTCFTEKLVAQLVPENSREHQRKIG